MAIRPLTLTAAFVVALAGSFVLPQPVEARGGRRNYAAEWEREERIKAAREEREKARQQHLEHQQEMQRQWQEHSTERQKNRLDHNERQLDKVLDHWEGKERTKPAAPPAKKGTCIYGAGNKVLYQPDGVSCER